MTTPKNRPNWDGFKPNVLGHLPDFDYPIESIATAGDDANDWVVFTLRNGRTIRVGPDVSGESDVVVIVEKSSDYESGRYGSAVVLEVNQFGTKVAIHE